MCWPGIFPAKTAGVEKSFGTVCNMVPSGSRTILQLKDVGKVLCLLNSPGQDVFVSFDESDKAGKAVWN